MPASDLDGLWDLGGWGLECSPGRFLFCKEVQQVLPKWPHIDLPLAPTPRPLQRGEVEENLQYLTWSYQEGLSAFYTTCEGRRFIPPDRIILAAGPRREFFVGVADRMLELGVCPVGWVWFACTLWQQYRDGYPPYRWAYSRKMLDRGYKSYRRRAPLPVPGQAPPSLLELRSRYMGLQYQLEVTTVDVTDPIATARAVVSRWFPGTLFDELWACALQEIEDIEAGWKKEAAAGKWIWRNDLRPVEAQWP